MQHPFFDNYNERLKSEEQVSYRSATISKIKISFKDGSRSFPFYETFIGRYRNLSAALWDIDNARNSNTSGSA